jgi:hypothetical protein
MKYRISELVPAISCCIILLTTSTGALAADWSWAEYEISNGNYGEAADWVIDSLEFEGGEDYTVEDAVCRDYLVSIEKHRDSNPQGRGKYQEVTDVEVQTYCQPQEEVD